MNEVWLDKTTWVKRNNEVFASEIDDEVVMMHVKTGKYYGLDDIGSRIWELMETKIQVQEIINQLMKEYEVSQQECEKDVLELMENLKAQDLIIPEK
jgi:polyhydroxyalkanoate synthesis regulator phasin